MAIDDTEAPPPRDAVADAQVLAASGDTDGAAVALLACVNSGTHAWARRRGWRPISCGAYSAFYGVHG